jgi:hypothetical protein
MLSIDLHTRDQLRMELAAAAVCLADVVGYAESAQAPAALDETRRSPGTFALLRRRAAVVLHLLDDIGWEYRGDRDAYHLTTRPADLRWWIVETLTGVEEELRACAACFAAGGHSWPDDVVQDAIDRGCASGRTLDEVAAQEVIDARHDADRALDLRAVLVTLLERLDRKGGA